MATSITINSIAAFKFELPLVPWANDAELAPNVLNVAFGQWAALMRASSINAMNLLVHQKNCHLFVVRITRNT
jgi:hypothetical protein